MDYYFRTESLTFDELFNRLNEKLQDRYEDEQVSKRTLRYDIEVFRDEVNGFGAPLPRKHTYRYSDPNFSISKKPLLEYENYLIDAAQVLLERFENDPKYEKLAETLLTFQDEDEQSDELNKTLYFDHNDDYIGFKYLRPFYHYIRRKTVLKITYQGYGREDERTYEFHPHILKQYNKRWFVFGLNSDENNSKWSIPLDDRLVKIEESENQVYIKSDVDWRSHFNTMIGVVRPNEAIARVVLKFYNGRKSYFTSKPFHPAHEDFFEEEKKDWVWFDSIINRELVQQILQYGPDVEVLEPPELRQEVAEKVKELSKRY